MSYYDGLAAFQVCFFGPRRKNFFHTAQRENGCSAFAVETVFHSHRRDCERWGEGDVLPVRQQNSFCEGVGQHQRYESKRKQPHYHSRVGVRETQWLAIALTFLGKICCVTLFSAPFGYHVRSKPCSCYTTGKAGWTFFAFQGEGGREWIGRSSRGGGNSDGVYSNQSRRVDKSARASLMIRQLLSSFAPSWTPGTHPGWKPVRVNLRSK